MSGMMTHSAMYECLSGAVENAREELESLSAKLAVATPEDLERTKMAVIFYMAQVGSVAQRKRELPLVPAGKEWWR